MCVNRFFVYEIRIKAINEVCIYVLFKDLLRKNHIYALYFYKKLLFLKCNFRKNSEAIQRWYIKFYNCTFSTYLLVYDVSKILPKIHTHTQ